MTKRRIALSASYWMVPCVQHVLAKCEIIYTTNVDKRDELFETFGRDSVRFIPFGNSQMLDFLKANHPDCETLTFGDLRKIIHDSLVNRNVQTARHLADYCGWKITPRILFDDEGVEGEEWSRRDNTATYECFVGEVPEAVFKAMAYNF